MTTATGQAGCRQCKQKIAEGVRCVLAQQAVMGTTYKGFYHLTCVTDARAKQMASRAGGGAGFFERFKQEQAEQQQQQQQQQQ